jgi:disulfide bond formation protein DsbB
MNYQERKNSNPCVQCLCQPYLSLYLIENSVTDIAMCFNPSKNRISLMYVFSMFSKKPIDKPL